MSTVVEIENAIKKLAPEEFAELASWVDERRARKIQDEEFSEALTNVFGHHESLLKKLAQ